MPKTLVEKREAVEQRACDRCGARPGALCRKTPPVVRIDSPSGSILYPLPRRKRGRQALVRLPISSTHEGR